MALPDTARSRRFALGDGDLGKLIDEFDWSTTALGPVEHWPPVICNTVGLILRSPVPMVTLWGQDGVMIYNDAYRGIAGWGHPGLLGAPVRQGWSEIVEFNDHMMSVVLAGGTLSYRDQELALGSAGQSAQQWFNLDYSPIVDEAGKVAGVVAIVVETTARVCAERALAASDMRLRSFAQAMPHQVWAADASGALDWFRLSMAWCWAVFFCSSMSVLVPIQPLTLPSASRRGTARFRCQR
ncbi:PAS fold-containing protein [Massilia yuzhufengensis]|uniref:PAS fold-containing protein n=1 Tax=Massilia yuzhufengensis TaxID=1164594 RepID=A0A1I1UML2_9BURK|nr:PAS fold-containing protein [Massilia yuzhufengensis]